MSFRVLFRLAWFRIIFTTLMYWFIIRIEYYIKDKKYTKPLNFKRHQDQNKLPQLLATNADYRQSRLRGAATINAVIFLSPFFLALFFFAAVVSYFSTVVLLDVLHSFCGSCSRLIDLLLFAVVFVSVPWKSFFAARLGCARKNGLLCALACEPPMLSFQ